MNEVTVQRSADVIAVEITTIKAQVKQTIATGAFEIGKRLCEAKEIVPSGEWLSYIENRLDYKKSTAENLMRIFRECAGQEALPGIGKSPAELFGQLSQSQMVSMLSLPVEQRAELVESNPELPEMSAREIQKLVKDIKAAEKEKADAEKERDRERKAREKADKLATDQADRAEKAETQLKTLRQSSADLDKELDREREERGRLEEKVRELESRPIEINAEPSEEMKAQIRAEAQAEMRQRIEDANRRADAAERKAARGNVALETRINIGFQTVNEGLKQLMADIRKYAETEPSKAEKLKMKIAGLLEIHIGKERLDE